MTVFFFVRHAVTPETGKRLSGWTRGVHLSEEGVAQAEGAASILDKAGITALYSSPVDRALETARIIGSRIGVDTVVRKGLGEVRFGLGMVRFGLWDGRFGLWMVRFGLGTR